jgi:hypothetical protein
MSLLVKEELGPAQRTIQTSKIPPGELGRGKSLNLRDPVPQDDQLRPYGFRASHRNLHALTPDEMTEMWNPPTGSDQFAKQFHVDVKLDNAKLEETFQETVNLFLAPFRIIRDLGPASIDFGHAVLPHIAMFEPSPHVAAAFISGSPEKPILLLGGFGNGQEIIKMEWYRLRAQGFAGSVVDATKLVEVFRSEWRKRILTNDTDHEFKLLNYDEGARPRFLDIKVCSQPFLVSQFFC